MQEVNPACQMERFPRWLDFIHISVWERSDRKCLERRGLFKKNKILPKPVGSKEKKSLCSPSKEKMSSTPDKPTDIEVSMLWPPSFTSL